MIFQVILGKGMSVLEKSVRNFNIYCKDTYKPSTSSSYKKVLDKFLIFIALKYPSMTVNDLAGSHLIEYKNYLLQGVETNKLSIPTLNKTISIIKTFYKFLEDNGEISNTTHRIKREKTSKKNIEYIEYAELLNLKSKIIDGNFSLAKKVGYIMLINGISIKRLFSHDFLLLFEFKNSILHIKINSCIVIFSLQDSLLIKQYLNETSKYRIDSLKYVFLFCKDLENGNYKTMTRETFYYNMQSLKKSLDVDISAKRIELSTRINIIQYYSYQDNFELIDRLDISESTLSSLYKILKSNLK